MATKKVRQNKKLVKAQSPLTEVNKKDLKDILRRIDFLEAEKLEIELALSEVYHEAHGAGFDVFSIKALIDVMKAITSNFDEETLDEYMAALGISITGLDDFPREEF